MSNLRIRIALTENGLRQWELARLLGVHEVYFSRRMRDELPAEEQDKIIELIRQHSKTVRGGEHDRENT
ncbi:MAG: hypothetical protein IK140_02080 [Clostridia bacterium]|nr:hypothetical protein [Clostridia bacterium]